MRLAGPLFSKGARLYDICYWSSDVNEPLHRTDRQVHYPAEIVDVLDPYMILIHQGMVENLFIEDMASRGVEVQ
jgi:phenol 2-monooxygenase (NADPH)